MKRLCLVGALVCALAAVPVGASTFVAMDGAELVGQSDAVVVGEVLYTYSYWNAEGTMIFTDAVIHVRESVLGNVSGLVSVRTPGGTVADYRVDAHGFPVFGGGQTQFLFLRRTAEGMLEVTGFQQGQYRVVTRSDGAEIAVPALKGVRLLAANGQAAPMPRALPLETLRASVRAQASEIDRTPRVK
jgi:hypothetical protein